MENNTILFTFMVWFILYVLHYVRKNKDIAAPEFLTHAGIAIVTIFIMLTHKSQQPDLANAILFAVATIEGIGIYTLDLTRKPISATRLMTHRIMAVLSIGVLMIFALGAI